MIAALLRLRIGERWGLRDYGIEQIFGGDKDCEHDWSGCGKSSQRLRDPKTSMPNCLNPEMGNTCFKCQAWKGQLGLEPTPELYIEHLTEIFNEVKRVLKKEGTLWIVIGDTYGGSGGAGGDYNKGGLREGQPRFKQGETRLPAKCLTMIPERLAWSLIQNGWILRNKNIWHKRNSMPSSVTDRFSNTYEFVYMFSTSPRYYFDLDSVREPATASSIERYKYPYISHGETNNKKVSRLNLKTQNREKWSQDGKNPGDVFEINTQPWPSAHFAVFPEKLCEKPIKAGCPEEVCKKCGKARERIIERVDKFDGEKPQKSNIAGTGHGLGRTTLGHTFEGKTIGWTSCKCNAGFEGGIVLDPFAGAGTALLVAKEMKRRHIGIDIKQEYCDMCEKRLAQGVL